MLPATAPPHVDQPRVNSLKTTRFLSVRVACTAREIMQAIASAPASYRDVVIAVDLLGLSCREAARPLRSREATITTRFYRGRQRVAGELIALA